MDGGLANAASIELSFFAVPSDASYLAEAYHCDQYNQRLEDDLSLFVGQSVRICISPVPDALDVGIRISSIDSFNFTRSSSMQYAIEDNEGTENGQSVMLCMPGSESCAFRTILQEDFFTSDGKVDGKGLVSLQYSQGSTVISRRLLSDNDRRLQENPLLIAGQSAVEIATPVRYQDRKEGDPCKFEHEFTEWWVEEDLKDRYKYIGIVTVTGISIAL